MAKRKGNNGGAPKGGDYEVGYKKPPHHSRFKKGQSGNPAGRPRRRLSLSDVEAAFDKALSAYITVNENGSVHQMKKVQALATQTVNKAVKGNHQAANLLMTLFARRAAAAPEGTATGPTADEFKAELESIFQEIAAKIAAGAKRDSKVEGGGESESRSAPPDGCSPRKPH